MSPLELTFYTITVATLIYILTTTIFNRKRLPPGPKPWPIIGNFRYLSQFTPPIMTELAQTYGPLFRLKLGSVNVVVVSSASMASQYVKTHDANFASRPPAAGAKYIAYNYEDVVFAPYGPCWRMLRKVCAVHLFSSKAMEDLRPIRQEEVAVLTRTLAKGGPKPVQLVEVLSVCLTNSLSRTMLGKRVVGEGTTAEFQNLMDGLASLGGGSVNIGDYFPALERFDLQGIGAKMTKIHKGFDKYLSAVLEEHKTRLEKGDHGGDFLSTMISLKDEMQDDGVKLTDTNIKALLLNLFIAGTDPPARTVESAIEELISHPHIMTQVHKELDSVVGRDRLVNEADIPKLTYLQAVIKETYRFRPAQPFSLPRIAAQPCEINGYYIPKNSSVHINVWGIARDPKVWTDPLEFKPERFLQGGEKANIDVKGNDFELLPFGAGRRICIGMSLGIRMVQFLTAAMVHAFDWEVAEVKESKTEKVQNGPLLVQPRVRLSAQAYANLY